MSHASPKWNLAVALSAAALWLGAAVAEDQTVNIPSGTPLPEAINEKASPTSCAAIFDRIRTWAPVPWTKPSGELMAFWTTNYYVPERNALFLGTTVVRLNVYGRDIFGQDIRSERVPVLSGTRQQRVSLRVRADNKIMFNEMYGPFEPTCSRGKFVTIDSSDSIEVLTFLFFR